MQPISTSTTQVVWSVAQAVVPLADMFRPESIKSAARSVAAGVMEYHTGDIISKADGYYYWWDGRFAWGAMVDYWYLTGDGQYNDDVARALQFIVDSDADHLQSNHTRERVRPIGRQWKTSYVLTRLLRVMTMMLCGIWGL